MALLSDYTAGSVTASAGGTAVTGSGTAWQTAGFQEGDIFIAPGWCSIIQSVNSNTSITLYPVGIRGAALSGSAYRLRYMSDGSRVSAQARALIDLLGGTGNLEAIAGLSFAANKLIKTTGPGSVELIDLSAVGIQDPNGKLAALRDLTWAANKGLLLTGTSTASTFDLTAFMRTLLDDANASAALTTLGVSAFIKTLLDDANAEEARATLELVKQTGVLDGTTGRLMGVGAFGLGVEVPETVTAAQVDTYNALPTGFYRVQNPNGVPAYGYYGLQVLSITSNLTHQILTTNVGAVAYTFSRLIYSGGSTQWEQDYNRRNIVGAVSQSSGVPTGAIIEDGSNANGRYAKFANGTMLCMGSLATSNSADVVWTFPAAFAVPPALSCGPTTAAATLVNAFFRNDATTTSASFAGYNANGRLAMSCTQLAVGRWY